MNLMKDRFDNMESWEDIENNIEGSTSEKYPSSNRERFVNVSKTFYKFFSAYRPIRISQSLPQKLPLVKMSVLLLYNAIQSIDNQKHFTVK